MFFFYLCKLVLKLFFLLIFVGGLLYFTRQKKAFGIFISFVGATCLRLMRLLIIVCLCVIVIYQKVKKISRQFNQAIAIWAHCIMISLISFKIPTPRVSAKTNTVKPIENLYWFEQDLFKQLAASFRKNVNTKFRFRCVVLVYVLNLFIIAAIAIFLL